MNQERLDVRSGSREPYRVFTRDQIISALRQTPAQTVEFQAQPLHASVAVIFAEQPAGLEVCFIRRAEREGDPWSGHVSFPGGRADPRDTTPAAVAERETAEEIGLALDAEHCLGALPVLPGLRRGVTLFPYVYLVTADVRRQATVMCSQEVASVFWVPVEHLFDDRKVTSLDYCLDGHTATFPGIRFQDHVIWGLTLHVLHCLARQLNRRFPALDGDGIVRDMNPGREPSAGNTD